MKAGVLFAGGGGADIGLKNAGLDVVWAIEKDPAIAAVHALNFPQGKTLIGDVRAIDPRGLESVDWLHASPPCQQYSSARKNTDKVHLEWDAGNEIVRFAEHLNPQFISIENVPGYAGSRVFISMVERLRQLGYFVTWNVFNAHDFNVPQERFRLFMIACKHFFVDINIPADEQKPGWYKAIADLLSSLPEDGLAKWQVPFVEQCKHRPILILRAGANTKCPAIRQAHQPAPTVRAFAEWGGTNWVNFIGKESVCRFTSRATARIQSFPDSYVLPEKLGLAQKIIGNAVPPPMMQAIAEHCLSIK